MHGCRPGATDRNPSMHHMALTLDLKHAHTHTHREAVQRAKIKTRCHLETSFACVLQLFGISYTCKMSVCVYIYTQIQTDRQTDRQTDTRTDKQTDTQTGAQTHAQTHRRTDAQTHKHAEKQTATDRQPDRPAYVCLCLYLHVYTWYVASYCYL